MTNADDTVTFRVENRIAWVKFNRPEKRNCMSPTLNRRMMQVLDELEFRDDVGVLVLTGAGEEDGFFDALSAGPVSATDPRVLGGDLVTSSLEPRP